MVKSTNYICKSFFIFKEKKISINKSELILLLFSNSIMETIWVKLLTPALTCHGLEYHTGENNLPLDKDKKFHIIPLTSVFVWKDVFAHEPHTCMSIVTFNEASELQTAYGPVVISNCIYLDQVYPILEHPVWTEQLRIEALRHYNFSPLSRPLPPQWKTDSIWSTALCHNPSTAVYLTRETITPAIANILRTTPKALEYISKTTWTATHRPISSDLKRKIKLMNSPMKLAKSYFKPISLPTSLLN